MKGEDQMRNTKPIQMYLEEVKEAYKWWRPLQNKSIAIALHMLSFNYKFYYKYPLLSAKLSYHNMYTFAVLETLIIVSLILLN